MGACTFADYSRKENKGRLRALKEAVLLRNNPAEEFAALHHEMPELSASGFMLAHCAWRRFCGILKREGQLDELRALFDAQGCRLGVTITEKESAKSAPALVSAMRWAEYTNIVRDMSECHEKSSRGEVRFSATDVLPAWSGIPIAMTRTKVHDIAKPERRGDPNVTDDMADALLDCWEKAPCFESRVAASHITTLSRSTAMLRRFADRAPHICDQASMDEWVVGNARYHVKPSSRDRETSCCMPVPTHPHYMGRNFGELLRVLLALDGSEDFNTVATRVTKSLDKAAEFIVSHYMYNLCWAAHVAGEQPGDSAAGRNVISLLRAWYAQLQDPNLDFENQMPRVVSKRNTAKFAAAFLPTPQQSEVPSFVRNPMKNVMAIESAGDKAHKLFAGLHRTLHSLSWPLTVRVTGWKKEVLFNLPESMTHALNILVTACMCEKIRRQMAAAGWHRETRQLNTRRKRSVEQ